MRTLNKNKQAMKVSHFKEATTQYERDSEGNIVYTTVNGTRVPLTIGSIEEHYDTPIDFLACITSTLNELHARSYGVDQSSIYSTLIVSKDYIDLRPDDIIWRTSEIVYKSDGFPDETSADYKVVGLMTEGLYEDLYLLQRLSVA